MKALKTFLGTDAVKMKIEISEWAKKKNIQHHTIHQSESAIEKLLDRPEGQAPEIVFTFRTRPNLAAAFINNLLIFRKLNTNGKKYSGY